MNGFEVLLAGAIILMCICIVLLTLGITSWMVYHFILWVQNLIERKRNRK